jgi:hypothetical protein
MSKLFFCTGTNCSGKSSIAHHFKNTSPSQYEILFPEYKNKLYILPEHNLILVGRYGKAKCGGCDTIQIKAHTLAMLRRVWERSEDIFMEGYLIGTMIWANQLIEMTKEIGPRELIFLQLNTSLETCFKRIAERSGKEREQLANNGQNVIGKYNQTLRFAEYIKTCPEWKTIVLDGENSPTPMIINEILKYGNNSF